MADTGTPVPGRFAAALIAAEDAGFRDEPGIDPAGVARAVAGILAGTPGDHGGATLEQQLAKLLYTPASRGWAAKLTDAAVAAKLDGGYPKWRILEMYAATVYFGHGYYGLTAAACGYFYTPPSGLDWAQASLLAGIVQAPSADDPSSTPPRRGPASGTCLPGWPPSARSPPPRRPRSAAARWGCGLRARLRAAADTPAHCGRGQRARPPPHPAPPGDLRTSR